MVGQLLLQLFFKMTMLYCNLVVLVVHHGKQKVLIFVKSAPILALMSGNVSWKRLRIERT